ncbi:MAG: DUF192 domain-containing protein, partial [bacterium]|nr:DUF192 domain-containing protein [bacterium]
HLMTIHKLTPSKITLIVLMGAAIAVVPALVFAPEAPVLQEFAPQQPPSQTPHAQASFPSATLQGSKGPVSVTLEIADTPEARSQGLMYRESLPENQGMLFVFEQNNQGAFWMKNTLIPLDIIFIDETKRIIEILPMDPCRTDPCALYLPPSPYRYALEVNQGFTKQYDIQIGSIVAF